MPYLNGKIVPEGEIDPKKHKFVGVFRATSFEMYLRTLNFPFDVMMCSCKASLWTREQIYDHWLQGHMDENMYFDIE